MQSTPLSTIIARMNRLSPVFRNTEEQFLVYDLDEALRNLKRNYQTPWTLQKNSLRVFGDILEYPMDSNHLALAYVEGREGSFEEKPRPYYTSIQEFYSDPNNKSQYAEIWNGGSRYMGIRNKNLSGSYQAVDQCEMDSDYTLTGDFTAKAIDNVIYEQGNGSLRLTLVDSLGTATLEKTFTGISGTLYQRKYVFARIYLTGAPTSITLRFGADSSNYLYKTVTTQFSGQAFTANDWNWIAMDLNDTDGVVGSVGETTTFAYYAMTLTGATSGLYYIDRVTLNQWALMDYWFYSNLCIKSETSSIADKAYFLDNDNLYETSDELVCPDEFVDVAMYDAIRSAVSDVESREAWKNISDKRQDAWDSLLKKFPSMEPIIITSGWRFASQMGNVVKWYGE